MKKVVKSFSTFKGSSPGIFFSKDTNQKRQNLTRILPRHWVGISFFYYDDNYWLHTLPATLHIIDQVWDKKKWYVQQILHPACYITHRTQEETLTTADSTPCLLYYTPLIKYNTRTNSICSRFLTLLLRYTYKIQEQTVSAEDSTPCQSHYTPLIKCDTRTNSLCSRLPGNTNNVVNSVNIRTFYGENSEAFIAQGNSIETLAVSKTEIIKGSRRD